MSIFLAGRSAAEYCKRYPLPGDVRPYAVAFRRSSPTTEEIRAATRGYLSSLSKPLEIILPGNAPVRPANTHADKIMRRYWSCHLPNKAFMLLDEAAQIYVSTPAFAFMQTANRLSLIELILLGYELCGTYFLPANSPAEFQSKVLLEPGELRQSILATSGYAGHRKAIRAARHIVAKSASPRETALVLILCLPCHLGGYGLPFPQMNVEVAPACFDAGHVSQRTFICDLYWGEARLDVEYDSDVFHAGTEKIARDARRRSELALLDVQSITVTNAQLKSVAETEKLAHLIAHILGVRIRHERLFDWRERHDDLRRVLFVDHQF